MPSPDAPPLPPPVPTLGDQLARDLVNAVSGEVRLGLHDRMLYATDASLYQVEPLAVVIPASVEDAACAVRFCVDRGLPILPRGGGTSLAGQCTNRAVVLDLSVACRALLEVDAPRRRCRVEPGITIDDLNALLAPAGLFFAPDPATSRHCNIGGAIGNNAAGGRSILYGRTSENLLGVDVVLATGQRVRLERGARSRDPVARDLTDRVVEVVRRHERLIRERFPRTVRRNAGYGLDMVLAALDHAQGDPDAVNLAHLLAGSEGTLGVTLGAELLLHPLPTSKGLAAIAFPSVDEAIDEVVPILATHPSAVELLDDVVLGLAASNTEYRRYVDLMPRSDGAVPCAVLYVEYFSDAEAASAPRHVAARLDALVERFGAPRVRTFTDAPAMLDAWKLRKAGEPLLHGMPGARKPITFIEDNAIPVERLGEFVRRLREIVTRHGTRAAYWAHASVGVLHVRPMLDIHDDADRARLRSIAVETARLARELGGVMSGEHGDGRVRGPLLEEFFGPELVRAFAEVKRIFDPRGLLNPGIIVPAPGTPAPGLDRITEHLRVRPHHRDIRVPPTDTYFDYHDQHGFEGAVEMCNGAGVCRKKQGGTMCPSYMATLDERHSTRGRGNALRLAITGQLGAQSASTPTPAWNNPQTQQTLGLCLSCKACKAECPSNVDVARLKAEYTAQGFRAAGRVPLRVRIMSSIRTLNALGSRTPRLANRLNALTPVRRSLGRILGLHDRRSLPAFAPGLGRHVAPGDRFVPAAGSVGADARPLVALFGDCFAMGNEPGIALAARRVLEACGYRVLLPRHGCCARPAISLGWLERARSQIDQTCLDLRPFIQDARVRAILFLEPSCLSAIKDDWLSLKVATPLQIRRQLAAKSWLAEEFVDRQWDQHPRSPRFAASAENAEPVLLHAHCHQKALWGAETSARLLRRLPGPGVRVLDSGCCGMAGSFGYDADRFDLSMRIGELALFPAIRAAQDACIAAPGTSCRHQIKDGVSRHALHPIEIVAQRLDASADRPAP